MSTALITLKGKGRSRFTVRATRDMADFEAKLAKASKVPTPAAARARFARMKVQRFFPSLIPGMSTAAYAKQYAGLNRNLTDDAEFFQPLNSQPCALPVFEGVVLQEYEDEAEESLV